jgi:hypothetical protein
MKKSCFGADILLAKQLFDVICYERPGGLLITNEIPFLACLLESLIDLFIFFSMCSLELSDASSTRCGNANRTYVMYAGRAHVKSLIIMFDKVLKFKTEREHTNDDLEGLNSFVDIPTSWLKF